MIELIMGTDVIALNFLKDARFRFLHLADNTEISLNQEIKPKT